jgi:hypothetical protein
MTRSIVLVLIAVLTAPASAQPEDSAPAPAPDPLAPQVVYDARLELDLCEVRVEGETTKPAGATVAGRTATTWTPLLDLRTDFDEAVVASVSLIR